MQRYNEPAESTSRRSVDILDSPSDRPRTPPRRSILRQPTVRADSPPRRGDLRQPTLLDSPSRSEEDDSALSIEEDDSQLADVYRTIRDYIREDVSFDTLEQRVGALRGHQDLKNMLPDNMDYAPGLRRLADMLELIDNKRDALESVTPAAESDTDVEPMPESESEEDSPAQGSGIVYDSDDEDVPEGSEPYDPFAPIAEADTGVEPMTESESDEEFPLPDLGYDSDDLADLMDSDEDRVTDVSARLRF